MNKGALLALLILVSSCSPLRSRWNLEKIQTAAKSSSFNRLYFSSCDPFSNLEFEILGNSSNIRLFLNVFSLGLPIDNPYENTVTVKMSTDEEQQHVQAYLYKGDQRLLLPPMCSEWIIENLQQGKAITIEVERYCTRLFPANFSQQYRSGQFNVL
jgi:hypothetical protein